MSIDIRWYLSEVIVVATLAYDICASELVSIHVSLVVQKNIEFQNHFSLSIQTIATKNDAIAGFIFVTQQQSLKATITPSHVILFMIIIIF